MVHASFQSDYDKNSRAYMKTGVCALATGTDVSSHLILSLPLQVERMGPTEPM